MGGSMTGETQTQETEPRNKPSVLIVDDDPTMRELVGALIAGSGMASKVQKVENGQNALKLVDAGNIFGIVITDKDMKSAMTGIDLAKELNQRNPATKVILISGTLEDTDQPVVLAGQNIQIEAAIPKGIGFNDRLLKTFTRIIESQEKAA